MDLNGKLPPHWYLRVVFPCFLGIPSLISLPLQAQGNSGLCCAMGYLELTWVDSDFPLDLYRLVHIDSGRFTFVQVYSCPGSCIFTWKFVAMVHDRFIHTPSDSYLFILFFTLHYLTIDLWVNLSSFKWNLHLLDRHGSMTEGNNFCLRAPTVAWPVEPILSWSVSPGKGDGGQHRNLSQLFDLHQVHFLRMIWVFPKIVVPQNG